MRHKRTIQKQTHQKVSFALRYPPQRKHHCPAWAVVLCFVTNFRLMQLYYGKPGGSVVSEALPAEAGNE